MSTSQADSLLAHHAILPFLGRERVTQIEVRDEPRECPHFFLSQFGFDSKLNSFFFFFVGAENGRLELENRNITIYCEIL